MYRWKETVRSKGGFYGNLAAGMDALHGSEAGVGAAMVAAALRGLNDVVLHMHGAKLTRNQIVMFTLADMMTVCEVAEAFAAKAARLAGDGDPAAGVFCAMSRVFARKAVRMVSNGAVLCAGGWTAAEDEQALAKGAGLLAGVEERFPLALTAGLWRDMETVGEYLKTLD
jgi:alkylation response protein AidB-like acyl-CoA dehydrogenase